MSLLHKPSDDVSWEDKTEKLLGYFDSRKKFRMKGYSCNHDAFGKKLRDNIEEWIKFAEGSSEVHPFDQLESKRDVLYQECPECGEETTFVPK